MALKRGLEARKAGRLSEARSALEEAVTEAPTWSVARLELAQTLLELGAPPAKIAPHLDAARRSDPDNPRLYYLLGLLAEERRNPEEAAAAYARALHLRPSLSDARIRLGRLHLEAKRYHQAIATLEPAKPGPANALALHIYLARAYEGIGDFARAEARLRAIVRNYPKHPYHLERLARFYERIGRPEAARRARRRADATSGRKARRLRPLPRSRR